MFKGILEMDGDKALSLDGLTMDFWKFSWDFVKEEIMKFFMEVHQHTRFVKSLNATFLALIPKKGGAKELRDFRPISWLSNI